MDQAKAAALAASTDMEPVHGTVDVDIPIDVLWEAFRDARQWPRWNKCMFWAMNKDLVKGQQLIWCFNAIKWFYPYKMPAAAEIIEVEPGRKVTWEVNLLGLYAHHTYSLEDLGNGRTRFGSWEKATGPSFRLTRAFWLAHFVFVKDESLAGAKVLEALYKREGKLDMAKLPGKYPLLQTAALALLLALGVFGAFLYSKFLRVTETPLGTGMYAVTGGCNSLVVEDGGEALVVDPKFPPMSGWFQSWVNSHVHSPVTRVVNTHFHFDHTQGNALFPGARLLAQPGVPALMKARDGDFWNAHPEGLPKPADSVAGTISVEMGQTHFDIVANTLAAHTHADIWVHVRKDNADVVALGDMFFNGYYPFIDTGSGGSDLSGVVSTLRGITRRYPEALYLPGHGQLARAADVLRYADYLEALDNSVKEAHAKGYTEDEAVKKIDLSKFGLAPIPITHYGTLVSTAETNIRQAYQLQAKKAEKKDTAPPSVATPAAP